MAEQPKIAVLSGDLVGSSQHRRADLDRAFSTLRTSARRQAKWHGADLHFTRQRGDGWQVVLFRPKLTLRSALRFRATLIGQHDIDTYISAVEGVAPEDLADDLNAQTGPLFTRAGRDLDALKTSKSGLRMSHSMEAGQSGATNAAFILADHIVQGWTPAQALAMAHRLDVNQPSLAEIADKTGKSHQSISKSLIAAGIAPITAALIALEDTDLLP